MENDNFEKVEIFDTPEQLAASMQVVQKQVETPAVEPLLWLRFVRLPA